ncbi:toxin-antitoxin system HicB family antitoxin [Rhodococcus koreensis]|uniref:toxin-antitoxin system HicB family antitoxin n=1 Tax=Rhodococcus koreensis TaxID=99653 RepID=UPI0019808B1B|nr:toxin-antitoxin system HicB family antitoxin [Rhodococcus koreensis]QSE77969.1 toxin-antitoxin system HicB family antitoxin [Rhodococcus koreensis]
MDLTPYVASLRHELAVAAEAGGDDARALAERLTAPLESGVRLALLDALSAAASEITRDLAPGSVDLRLRGREPTFVVTPAPVERLFEEQAASGPDMSPPRIPEVEDGAMTRINLRLPQDLKDRVEEAAREAGLSVNAWLVRSAAAGLESDGGSNRSERRAPRGNDRFTGWVR